MPGREERRSARKRGGRPQAVGTILHSFLDRSGISQAMEDRRIIAEWEDLVGTALARGACPVRIDRGVLMIDAASAPHADHLMYLRPLILRQIRERFPQSRVREIRVIHRPGGGWSGR